MDAADLSRLTARHSSGYGEQVCDLCGTPLGAIRLDWVREGREFSFCCHGCRMVFEILFQRPEGPPEDYRKTDLYHACVEAGIIPSSPGMSGTAGPAILEPEASDSSTLPDGSHEILDVTFRIGGMWCTTCAVLVESVLRGTHGVVEARVSFFSDSAHVRYQPHRTSPQSILDRVLRLGYSAAVDADRPEVDREKKSLHIRLGIAAILTANIMMISWALYFGFFEEFAKEEVYAISWPLWILSTPVVFYAGAPILNKAVRGVLWGAVSMETLIAVGCLSAYLYSLHQMLTGGLHLYFDTAAMLVTLVLLGRTVEAGARAAVSRGVTDLLDAAGGKVRLIRGDREVWSEGAQAAVGEEFEVREGERAAVDGGILHGAAHVDESFLTGESRPVFKRPGDEILNGSRVLSGAVRARVVRPVRESLLEQMIRIIREALSSKGSGERTADRFMRWVVPVVLMLAAVTGGWVRAAGGSLEDAWQRGLSVLVITCPCALGIAVPLAKTAAVGVARLRGLLIRDFDALERAASLDVFVFDKTGTVTEGRFTLRGIEAPGVKESEVLRRVGAVEACSGHLIAREIVRSCLQMGLTPEGCSGFTQFEGQGVRGVVAGVEVRVGNRRFMVESGCPVPPELDERALQKEREGMTVPFFAWDGEVRGFLWFGDAVRPDSLQTLRTLEAMGVKLILLSGDSVEATRSVAETLRIREVMGSMLPADKADFVRSLQRRGMRVGVVGDGLNDAPALAQADVAFTMGGGADLLRQVSSITLLKGEMSLLLKSLAIAKVHNVIAAQNLFFAFVYNGLAIPVAMAGYLNPIMAVLAMFLSSITVLANTLRITRRTADDLPRRSRE